MESTRSLSRFPLPETMRFGILMLLVSVGCVALVLIKPGGIGQTLGDFRAFYCAGSVASQHLDPYTVAPLEACEAPLGLRSFFSGTPAAVLPAPLPGYLIAFFAIFSLIP
jgi:hypothetical protein